MDPQTKILLFTIGIVNGLFLAISMLRIEKSGRTSNYYLAFLLLAFSSLLIIKILEVLLNFIIMPLPICLILGPLTYLYVRTTIHSSQQFARNDIIHALPSIISFILFFTLYLQNLDSGRDDVYLNYMQPSMYLQRISMLGYSMAAICLLIKSAPSIRNDHLSDAKMLSLWIFLFIGDTLLVIYSDTLLITMNSIPIVIETIGELKLDILRAIGIVVLINTLGYIVITRRSLQDGFANPRTTVLDGDEVQHINKRIHELLTTDKLYRDPDFSLDIMAKSLNLSRHKVSAVLNIEVGSSFPDIINSHRLDDFKRLTALSDNKKKSVLELAFACGFNSKASFYRAFKSLEGMTPTQYRQNID